MANATTTRASQDATIPNPLGLHARPAAALAQLVSSLPSTVSLQTDTRIVNAASVLGIIASSIGQGDNVTVICEGDYAERDLAAVLSAIESGLGEQV
ncbi:MAG: HPr family phosphocarrier protein [Bifidobacteriaceae bacterium]|jgi:phosphotransferase system HPr (HPr) family protein|nr:HPr family phosphocarrier protein [Bifidobacteriaceae bacterium]